MLKKNKYIAQKKGVVAAIVLCTIVILTAVAAYNVKLNNAQKDFLSLLEREAGNYNENRIVLSSTSKQEAEAVAEVFGGTLRITDNGSFAVVNLPENVTLSDIAQNKAYRKYHDKILLDYTNFGVAEGDTDVAEDTEIRSSYVVDDPMYAQQTYIDYLNIGSTWDLTRGADASGEKVTVAVIDTGIDTDHPEFFDTDGNSIISTQSYDSTNDKVVDQDDFSVIEDTNGHGTAVAGVIAAQMNGIGITGVAPDVELLVIKCEADGTGEFASSADIVFALYYAIEMDADVINLSLGGKKSTEAEDYFEDLKDALQLAADSDIICVAAAGNETTDAPRYPAAFDTTIGVGALSDASGVVSGTISGGVSGTIGALSNPGWTISNDSNFGPNSDIVAPGTAVTAALGGGYTYKSGTSISAPMVSAAVALYKAQNPYVTYNRLKAELLAAGKDLGDPGEDEYYGFGALDVNAFVCEEKGTITYDYCTEDIENTTQVFVRRHTIQTVPEPEREKIILDDWYFDKAYTRVFDYDAWYTTEFVEDVTLYAKWVNEDDEDASVYNYKTLSDGTIEIVSYKGKRRYLTIPNEIDGKVVSSIGSNAFFGNTRLREVVFPEGLVYIKTAAFSGVSKMREITFTGSQLINIGEQAFSGCSSLRKLDLPDSVTGIGREAFKDCSVMTSVNISSDSNLATMGDFAFSNVSISSFYIPKNVTAAGFNGSVLSGCLKMRTVSVHTGNTAFTVSGNTLYNVNKTVIVYYPAALSGSYTVADTVESIGSCAFWGSSISEIELNSVAVLGTSAFASSKLTSLHIPASVQSIGGDAFSRCGYLQTLLFAEDSVLASIGVSAFSYCVQLKDFELPDTLESIGDMAFENCQSITTLTIPINISSIGGKAFQYCSSLRQVDFAEGCVLTTVPSFCFANCTKLTTVNFSDNISELETYAFSYDYLLNDLNFSDSSTLTTVGNSCFYSCSSLHTMQLPDSVTTVGQAAYAFGGLMRADITANMNSIGNGAFGACYLLTEIVVDESNTIYTAVDNVLFNKDITTVFCVPASRTGSYTLPETVKVTAPYSFYFDKFLTAVSLPQGLEDIQMNSFYSCSLLAGIDIPANVSNIGRKAFENCYSLKSVTFGTDSRLERLGIYTFVNCGISEITIPASVEEIAQYVFYNCNDLCKITFEKNSALTYIAAYLFKGTPVNSVVFEEGSALTNLQAHAFDGASSLQSIDFGDAKITNVDNYAFYNCAKLQNIDIPATVTYIGRYAFYGCSLLDRIDLPETVDYIGESAFSGTNNARIFFAADTLPANVQIGWDNGIAGYFLGAVDYVVTDEWEYSLRSDGTVTLAAYKGEAAALTIDTVDGYTVTKIGPRCFYNNDILTEITLGENITEIGNYAFYGCDNLTTVTVPASVTRIGKYAFADSAVNVSVATDSALKLIDDYAFSGNATTALVLPDTVTEVGEGTFFNSRLTNLTISQSSSLGVIGQQAFVGSAVKEIYLPGALTSVGVEAFKNVTTLTSVSIASGDTALKLSNGAFEGSGISEITIPTRVWYIGEYTFGSCQSLQNIHVESGNTSYTSLEGVLCDINGTTLIQYPCGRSGAYEVPVQITVLTYSSFRDAKGLTEVTFAEGSTVRTMGWQTFSGCESLTKITVPDTVVSFDFYAFENCTALKDVVLSENSLVTGVYEGAFYNCTALENITLPNAVTEIRDYAFYNCTALKQMPLSVDSKVKYIGDYAFFGCTGIAQAVSFSELSEMGAYAFSGTAISGFTVPVSLRNLQNSAFVECNELTNILCDEAHEDYESIEGVLYEKGASAGDLDAVVLWPYGKIYYLAEGKTELTAEDAAVVYMDNNIRWEIADTVKTIEDYAFDRCKKLYAVTIPESVTTIGDGAFQHCTALSKVTIPDSVTQIGYGAFAFCNSLKTAGPIGSGCDYSFGWTDSIPDNAFYYCQRLTKVLLPDTVTSIGATAFSSCSDLREITIPAGVTEIGNGAFQYCSKLKVIDLPEGLTQISRRCFGGTGLTQITIPKQVELIDQEAFSGSELTTITIPGSVIDVRYGAFSHCRELTSVVIEEGVKRIGACAFQSCGNLSSVIIPDSLRSFVSYTFADCPKLTSAGPVGGEYNIQYAWTSSFPAYVFAGSTYLEKVVIGESITEMGGYTFKDCPKLVSAGSAGGSYSIEFYWTEEIPACSFMGSGSLKDVVIPDTITQIGSSAFADTGLTEIIIPKSVEIMGGGVFRDCVGLTSAGPVGGDYRIQFYWEEELPSNVFDSCTRLQEMVIPEGVTSIGSSAFAGCSDLTSITIPEGVTSIGDSAFYGCSGLTSITIPEGVTSIGDSAFYGCSGLTSITIPKNVTSIGDSAFLSCASLEKILVDEDNTYYASDSLGVLYDKSMSSLLRVPCALTGGYTVSDTVTKIGSNAFSGCRNLTSITIPESVTSIGSNAFSDCNGLQTAGPLGGGYDYEFGWSESIPAYAFSGCSGLTSITIPECVTSVGHSVFSDCSGLTSITIPESVTSIGGYAFSGCTGLTSITIPESVTSIDYCAFYRCRGLTSITIPESVTSIGAYAFSGCTGLTSITIPESVTSIDNSAFSLCSGLVSVIIPESVTSIGNTVFQGCRGLTNITFNGEAPSIGASAFYGVKAIVFYSCYRNTWTTDNMLDYGGTLTWTSFDPCETSHSYEPAVTEPTCTESGYTTHTCSVCGDSYTDSETSALGHAEVIDTGKVATCTESGLTEGKHCSVCDEVLVKQEIIPATGHSFGEWIETKSASCTETGERRRDCENCEHYETEVIAAVGHNYESEVTAPTCTEQGYTTHTCSVCENIYKDSETPALGHAEVIDAGKAATCTESGLTEGKHCSVCDAVLVKPEIIPATGHSYKSVVAEPTCTEGGYTTHTCSVCRNSYIDSETEALGHNYESAVTEPTCTESGYTTHTCSVCGDTYKDSETPALGHTEVIDAGKAATCTETGLTEGKHCSVCDEVLVEQEIIPATGHSYGGWTVSKAASCTEVGEKRRDCENCDSYETEVIADVGHNYQSVVTEPTCTESGYTTHTCAGCGDNYTDSVTEAPGHMEVIDAGKAATCTETGLTEGKHCSVCDAVLVEQEIIPAKGHSYDSVVTEPTCTEQGYTTHTCSVCGDSYTDSETPAKGHSYETVVTKPTATEKGYTTYTCSVCGYQYVDDYVDPSGIRIVTQPETTYTKSGETAKATVLAEGEGLTYTWYFKNAKSTNFAKSSVTKATYSVKMSSTSKDRQIYCVVTDHYGNSVQSDTVTLHMAVTITQQPTDVSAAVGSVAKTKVTAVGDGLTYTWYYKNIGATKFTKTTAFTGNTYSVEMTAARNGRQVYCVITDKYGNSVQTETVTLTMQTPLEIKSQPKTTHTRSGETAKVTVAAEGDGLTYQWYIKNAGGTKYSRSSITKATYSCKMSSTSKDRQVYCVVTDAYGNSVTSDTVTLRMAATITAQPKSMTAANGETAKVTLKAVGDGLKYTWYYRNKSTGSFTKTTSFTGNTYSVSMSVSRNGRQVYCVVTDQYGYSVQSETVTLTMKTALSITTQPKTSYTKSGETARATVKAEGEGLTYQWYIKNAKSTKFSKSSVTKATYSVKMSNSSKNRQVYCVIIDAYGNTVTSKTVTLRMAATITSQPKSVTVANGEAARIILKAEGEGLTYSWYYRNKGAETFTKTTSFTGNTYSVSMSDARDGRQIYCVVADEYGHSVQSFTVTIRSDSAEGVHITEQPVDVEVVSGDKANVTVKADGEGLTYEWYFRDNETGEFRKTTSFTGDSYTVTMTGARDGRQIYCIVTDEDGNSVQSDTVVIRMTK